MLEIEKKCRLSFKDAEDVLKRLYKTCKLVGEYNKKDIYYKVKDKKNKTNNTLTYKNIFRIREQDKEQGKAQDTKQAKEYTICFKAKRIIRSTEINDEKEFLVSDIKVFKKFITYIGYEELVRKEKHVKLFKHKSYPNINIEYAKIKGLGYFIEVEYLSKTNSGLRTNIIIDTLDKLLFKELLLDKESLETRRYIEMLLLKE